MSAYTLQVITYWGGSVLDIVSTPSSTGRALVLVPAGAELERPQSGRPQYGSKPAFLVPLQAGERLIYRVGELKVLAELVSCETVVTRQVIDWWLWRIFAMSALAHSSVIGAFLLTPAIDVKSKDILYRHRRGGCLGGVIMPGRLSKPPLPDPGTQDALRIGMPDLPPDRAVWKSRRSWDHGIDSINRVRARPGRLLRRTPRVYGSGQVIEGELHTTQIDRVIKLNLTRFQYCYEKRLQWAPDLSGTLQFRFGVGPDGHVWWVGIGSSTMKSPGVRECSVKVLRSLRFPRPNDGHNASAEYLFSYSPAVVSAPLLKAMGAAE